MMRWSHPQPVAIPSYIDVYGTCRGAWQIRQTESRSDTMGRVCGCKSAGPTYSCGLDKEIGNGKEVFLWRI